MPESPPKRQDPGTETLDAIARSATSSASQALTIHDQPPSIPDYELLRSIASGAYGEVWLARNVVGTLRAVKIVRRDQHALAESFEREFKGLQKFEPISRTHEGLVDILTLGLLPDGGGFYYVMELADDGSESRLQPVGKESYSPRTLRFDLKTRGALPADEVIALGLKLTAAVAHLHAQGLVHRDIKPSNILFVGGEPKLADAGLVAAVDDARSLVGTAGYIPPEGPGTLQADIYSLGKVLYEAAFGKDRNDFPQLPPELGRRPDRAQLLELNEILLTACARNPAERYRSAEGMISDLEMLPRGQSVKRKHAACARWKLAWQISRTALPLALAFAGLVFVLLQTSRVRSLSSNPEAESLYKQAVYLLQRQTPEGAREAYTNLTKAVLLDSRFTAAHYKLFEVYFDNWGENLPPHFNRRTNMEGVAQELRELNADSAEYHTVNCWLKFDEWHFEEAVDEARRAISLNPMFARAHAFYGGLMLRVRGDPELARREFEIAASLDPSDVIILTWLGAPDFFERKFDRAIELYTRANRQEPRATGPLWRLAGCYEAKGEYEKAINDYEAAEASRPGNQPAIKARYDEQLAALNSGGPRAWYRTRLAQLRQSSPPDAYEVARVCARLGQTNEVLTLLERAYDERNGSMVDLLLDDCWDLLRDEPRFKALVRRMGLGPYGSEGIGLDAARGRP